MKDFFSRLNYSFGNEDWNVERKALQIAPNNHVLCITASGDRPLNLLLDGCSKLTALDANPVQNHLLQLKCAAMQQLDFDQYVQFLGGAPSGERNSFFEKVRSGLPQDAAAFWGRYPNMISKGILYQGQIERLTKLIAFTAAILRPSKIKKLFSFDNLDEQREFVKKEWDTKLMRKTFEFFLSKTVCNLVNFDPGLYTSVDPTIGLGTYIYNRMLNSLHRTLAKENMIISLIFRGFVGKEAFPPYLTEQGAATIRPKLPALSIQTGDLIQYLETAPAESIDRFSLSDVASYLDEATFYRMVKGVIRTAKPGARFCIRQFSSNHQIPEDLASFFKREHAFEKELEQEDTSFFYRFNVGTIAK